MSFRSMNTDLQTLNASIHMETIDHKFRDQTIDADLPIENNIEPVKDTDEKVCRICLSEEEPGNPIISPCMCTGSVKYIHLGCIKEWLHGKMHKKETPFVNSYIWRGLECEICK